MPPPTLAPFMHAAVSLHQKSCCTSVLLDLTLTMYIIMIYALAILATVVLRENTGSMTSAITNVGVELHNVILLQFTCVTIGS